MCLQCHEHISDDELVEQLKDSIKNPQFEKWNTTALSHVCIAIRGANGPEAHELALIDANNFYTWFLGATGGWWQYFSTYQPKSGLEPFPDSSAIRKHIDDSNQFYRDNKHLTRDEIRAKIFQPLGN